MISMRRVAGILIACAAVVGVCVGAARAESIPVAQIRKDLSGIQARVIEGPDGKMLVNKGRRDRVQKGDLFCISAKGQAVTDPQTGETLGSYAAPEAIGRVVRASEKFAEIRIKCLAPDCSVSAGQEAIRFRDVPARFMDADGAHFSDYTSIRAALPHLDWQGYTRDADPAEAQEASAFSVVFTAEDGRLTLWSGGEVKGVYTEGPSAAAAETGKAHQALDAPQKKPPAPGVAAPSGAADIQPGDFQSVASFDSDTKSIGVARQKETQTPFLLRLGEQTVEARALQGEKRFAYTYEGFGQVVNMSASGGSLAALNIYVPEQGMRSMLLELTEGGFRQVAENVPYVLAFMNRPGTGQATKLWGQRFSFSDLLLPVVYTMRLEADSVRRGKRVNVPAGFSLFGAFSADINGNGTPETGFFNIGGRLVIFEAGAQIWQSADRFAGSRGALLVHDPSDRDAAPQRLELFAQPAMLPQGARIAVAAALNRAGLTRMIGEGAEEGTVGVLQFTGSAYQLQMLPDHFQGPVRDICVWEDELLICVAQTRSFSQNGRSHVLRLPLDVLGPAADYSPERHPVGPKE